MKNLSQKWIDRLVDQPESGMGYQQVKVKLKNGQEYHSLVFNCEEFSEDLPFTEDQIFDIIVE